MVTDKRKTERIRWLRTWTNQKILFCGCNYLEFVESMENKKKIALDT